MNKTFCQGEGGRDDELGLWIYTQEIANSRRTTNRLRVTIPIRVVPVRDVMVQVRPWSRVESYRTLSFQIVRFPRALNMVASGVSTLTTQQFLATHPHVQPQSVQYQLVQVQSVNGRERRRITVQKQKNRRESMGNEETPDDQRNLARRAEKNS